MGVSELFAVWLRRSVSPVAAIASLSLSGAGEGNRTLVVSLEGFCSTIELHPPEAGLSTPKQLAVGTSRRSFDDPATDPNRPVTQCWWRGKDSNLRRQSRQIYS